MNIRTSVLMDNNLNIKTYRYGMNHSNDTDNNIFQQKHWKSILKEYNVNVKLNKEKFSLDRLDSTNFEIHPDGSCQDGKTGMGINIYNLSSPNTPHSYSHLEFIMNIPKSQEKEICKSPLKR